jgi:hypothetical protein
MKYKYLIIISLTLFSCNSSTKKAEPDQEFEYLNARNNYKAQLEVRQNDTVSDKKAIRALEERLRVILKNSKYSGRGKSNLQTFLGGYGTDNLDGMAFEQDFMRVVCSTENLCFDHFKTEKISQFEKMSATDFATLFTRAFEEEAFVTSVSFVKLPSEDGVQVYGMLGLVTQGLSNAYAPGDTYVLVSKGGYVYVVARKISIDEIPKCKEGWYVDWQGPGELREHVRADSIAGINYCKCYEEELKRNGQYKVFQKQVDGIVKFILP